MKYKVGDKVRVRKDLKVGKKYGKDYRFNDEMGLYKGKELTITNICKYSHDDYYYETKENWMSWIDEMLEPVEEIIEYKGKKYEIKREHKKTPLTGVFVPLWDTDLVLSLTEHKEEILDESEKRYLRNVIKYVIEPTHNEVDYISKFKSCDRDRYWIAIHFKNNDGQGLPYFNDKRMYKGMKLDKGYTLEELGLEE